MFDLLITGGKVVDGTGAPAVEADVAVQGDTIREVGALRGAEARATLSAAGKIVCPGFVDVHSHSDAYLLIEPSAPSKMFQGITTEVVGNCGASAAPRFGGSQMPSDWREKPYPGPWTSVREYRQLLESVKPGPNVVMLAGHNTLRAGVAGYENRPLTETELHEMVCRLEQCMDEGSRGLSTGLIYAPGMFAPRGEIVELAKAAGRRGGIYTSHMRSEGARLLEAIEEALAIGQSAGIRVEISHLKTSGKKNWGLVDRALELIRKARAGGAEVAADRYPYTFSGTDLDVIFPPWAAEGGREVILKRLKTPADRARLREDLRAARSGDDWGTIIIASTHHPDNRRFQGVPLPDAARTLGLEPADAVLYFAESDELRTAAFFSGMSEDNMLKILAEPYVMIGTDASVRSTEGVLSRDYPHPRAYGTFPRFLRMALDGKTVPLPEAVRKMTSLPAGHFRLQDRGILAAGKKADMVVFDPVAVADRSTYAAPHRFSEGVEHVIVNGVLTLSGGRFTGQRAGRVL